MITTPSHKIILSMFSSSFVLSEAVFLLDFIESIVLQGSSLGGGAAWERNLAFIVTNALSTPKLSR
jgi:hypothetical protein